MKFRTQDWNEVEARYLELPKFSPLVDLVRFIKKEGFADGIFPVTSMFKLRIGRYPDYESGDAELTLDYDPREKKALFTYFESEYSKDPWTRECQRDEINKVFERIVIKRLRWFKDQRGNKSE